METPRRAVRLILALEAWKLEHGSLPDSLDELVVSYFEQLPLDPYTAKSFRYCRDGINSPLSQKRDAGYQPNGEIAPNTPFVWSTGGQTRESWRCGWPFPIP
jgi:hypothetical protein